MPRNDAFTEIVFRWDALSEEGQKRIAKAVADVQSLEEGGHDYEVIVVIVKTAKIT